MKSLYFSAHSFKRLSHLSQIKFAPLVMYQTKCSPLVSMLDHKWLDKPVLLFSWNCKNRYCLVRKPQIQYICANYKQPIILFK